MSKAPTKRTPRTPAKRGPGRPSIDGDGGLTWSITCKFPQAVREFVDEELAANALRAPSSGQIIRDLVAEAIEARRRERLRKT